MTRADLPEERSGSSDPKGKKPTTKSKPPTVKRSAEDDARLLSQLTSGVFDSRRGRSPSRDSLSGFGRRASTRMDVSAPSRSSVDYYASIGLSIRPNTGDSLSSAGRAYASARALSSSGRIPSPRTMRGDLWRQASPRHSSPRIDSPPKSPDRKPVEKYVAGKKKKGAANVVVNLSACKYEVVWNSAMKMGWKCTEDERDWNIYWTDLSVSQERVMKMKQFQKINHFPGMTDITRKASLARNLKRMQRAFPDDYGFVPLTFVLPEETHDFKAHFKMKKKKGQGANTFIVKPDQGCQGRGIYLTRSPADVSYDFPQVAQRYVSRPFLIDGFKFDIRIYVLVLSCNPLKIFLWKDGLVRFCTEPYEKIKSSNMDNAFMHLSNYAINKYSDNFTENADASKADTGSKRSLKAVRSYLQKNGEDDTGMWEAVKDIVIKTLISIQPNLAHMYKSSRPNDKDGMQCFEVLGMDIMLDWKLRPWLIEVNHSPSFACGSPLDTQLKEGVLLDTMNLVNFTAREIKRQKTQEREILRNRLYATGPSKTTEPSENEDKRSNLELREIYERKNMGNYEQIYPFDGCEAEYGEFLRMTNQQFRNRFLGSRSPRAYY